MKRRQIDLKEAGRRRARECRAAQGLPPKITDPVVIDRIVALLLLPKETDLRSQEYRSPLASPEVVEIRGGNPLSEKGHRHPHCSCWRNA
jgi:hypothetical protein